MRRFKCEKLTDDERQMMAKAHLAFLPGELIKSIIYKMLHRKLKIEQHEPHIKSGVNSGALEG